MYLGEWELEDHGGYGDNDPMIVTLLDFGHHKRFYPRWQTRAVWRASMFVSSLI